MSEHEAQLAEIKARRATLTDLPWRLEIGEWVGSSHRAAIASESSGHHLADVEDPTDAEFIAHAPADIDFLLEWIAGEDDRRSDG